ncbi:MAG: UvrD-helicase domain-containing protein [Pirellulales bacterium]
MSDTVQLSHRLIRASAGTGKTFQLSNRYLGILSKEILPSEILATTFTRKGAGEILDRIMLRLAESAQSQKQLDELNQYIEGPSLTAQECRDTLWLLIKNLHRLQVKTLDSFFIKIAQCFSFELGFPPAWRIIEDQEDKRLRILAIGKVFSMNSVDDVVSIVHLLHKGESVSSVHESMLNTVNMLYKLYVETDNSAWHSIDKLPSPSQQEIVAAIDSIEKYDPENKKIIDALAIGLTDFANQNWDNFLGKGMAKKVAEGATKFHRVEIPDGVDAAFQVLLQQAKSSIFNRIIQQTEGAYELLQHFDREYRKLKQAHRGFRFEDITQSLARQPEKNDPQKLSFRMDAKINHLLLDEFQDTSSQQWQVLRPLAQRVTQQSTGRSYFCVGDMKQAIFGWRGGVAEIFDAVDSELPDLKKEGLAQSFRSSTPVIDTVNQVFDRLEMHPNSGRILDGIQYWKKLFVTHSTARKELQGLVTLETAWFDLEGETTDKTVLDLAAQRIQEITQKNSALTIGVIVRTNAMVGRIIYALRKLGITASEEGGAPLVDSAAVQLLLSLFELIDHPHNQVAAYHVANSELGELLGLTDSKSPERIGPVVAKLRRNLLAQGYGPVVDHWASCLLPQCNDHECSRLEQFIQLAYSFQTQVTLRTEDFVSFVETKKVSDPASSKVRVMNVHQSKGLQFDVVILPELDKLIARKVPDFVVERKDPLSPVTAVCRYANQGIQDLLPERFQKMFADSKRQQVVEDLCVLYVALTRAKHSMHLFIQPAKAKQKTIPLTLAGLLRTALNDSGECGENQILYQTGDPDWMESLSGDPHSTDEQTSNSVLKRLLIQMQASGKRKRSLVRVSPSSLEGGGVHRLQQVLQSGGNQRGMLYGSVMHAWLEQIQWLEEERPSEKQLRRIATQIAGRQIEFGPAKKQFDQHLQSASAKNILSLETYSKSWALLQKSLSNLVEFDFEVRNEHQYMTLDQGKVMTGSIDRLVLVKKQDKIVAADIIDYKTDHIADAAELQHKIEYYRPQVHAYRDTVSSLYNLTVNSMRCQLYFLAADQLVQL